MSRRYWQIVQTFSYIELRDAVVDEARHRGLHYWKNYPWTDEGCDPDNPRWSVHIGYFDTEEDTQAAMKPILDAAYKAFNKLMVGRDKL